MTTNEKAVTWGLLALIAWELWTPSRVSTPLLDSSVGDNIPEWVKQLSSNRTGIDFFNRACGLWGAR